MSLASRSLLGRPAVPVWISDLARRPTVPHVDDDEFDDGTVNAAWTQVTPSGTVTLTEKGGVLSVRYNSQNNAQVAGVVRSMTTTTAPITIETAVRWRTLNEANPMVGLMFANGTTTGSSLAAVDFYAQTGFSVVLGQMAGTFSSPSATNINTSQRWNGDLLYLRWIWTTTNTFKLAFSPDGVSWTDMGAGARSITLTPTHYGLFFTTWSRTEVNVATFEYFRVTEADLSV